MVAYTRGGRRTGRGGCRKDSKRRPDQPIDSFQFQFNSIPPHTHTVSHTHLLTAVRCRVCVCVVCADCCATAHNLNFGVSLVLLYAVNELILYRNQGNMKSKMHCRLNERCQPRYISIGYFAEVLVLYSTQLPIREKRVQGGNLRSSRQSR
jgi:hypothetical protein